MAQMEEFYTEMQSRPVIVVSTDEHYFANIFGKISHFPFAIESDTIVSSYVNMTIPGFNTSDPTISDPTDLDSMNRESINTGPIIPESINIAPAVLNFTNTDPAISDSSKTNSGLFIHIPPIYSHKKK
ncbi:hypothetical protein BJV82DRAFT_583734 [Fennellomyces sp. T-0311]|nr:hypothetical protein BJV82DRAFT_583734 [Fennellomyces sp. T-0311]